MKQAACWLLLAVAVLTACKSGQRAATRPEGQPAPAQQQCLTARLRLTLPQEGGREAKATGTVKMVPGERIQFSLQLPLVRAEVARIEFTPAGVLVIDRMHKQYTQATRKEWEKAAPQADYPRIERLLQQAAKTGKRTVLTGKALGLAALENAEVELYDFASTDSPLMPSKVSAKYEEIAWERIVESLTSSWS